MPAPQRHPAPHQQLLNLAKAARAEGLSFEEFWARALQRPLTKLANADSAPEGALIWPNDTSDRRTAYEAIVESREGWRRAYEGLPPTAAERALTGLSPLFRGVILQGSDSGPEVFSADGERTAA